MPRLLRPGQPRAMTASGEIIAAASHCEFEVLLHAIFQSLGLLGQTTLQFGGEFLSDLLFQPVGPTLVLRA